MTRTTHPRRRLTGAVTALGTLAVAAAALAAPPSALAAPPSALAAPTSATTPISSRVASATGAATHGSRDVVHVKFTADAQVRVRGGRLVSLGGTDLSAVTAVTRGDVRRVSPVFGLTETQLTGLTRSAVRSGRPQADLNSWIRLDLSPGADLAAVVRALQALPVVETAFAKPLAAPAPIAPDYSSKQGYVSAASASGIDAAYAQTVPGGRGGNVRITDIEYDWNTAHEDLSRLRAPGAVVPNGTWADAGYGNDHGTAVVGVLAGDDNGGGVRGLTPDAAVSVVNSYNTERGFDIPTAIATAAANSRPGDVILIEHQLNGPTGCGTTTGGYVAVEWYQDSYDAIVAATSKGVIVVEPAGNGGQDYDDTCLFGSTFPAGRPDSGAIIVGAGGAPGCSSTPRGRLGFSSYGKRVDVQGWGECVTTTGYGDLYGASANERYTSGFSGTSSASPIVAAAAASLSSIARQNGQTLTPAAVRATLKSSGTPQTSPEQGLIGPLPNLRKAITGSSVEWTAKASASGSGTPASAGVDGSPTTRWSTGTSQAAGQWYQIDLGTSAASQRFNTLVLDAGSTTSGEYPRGYAVRTSPDASNWSAPVTGSGTGRTTTVTLPVTTARYVRVTLTASSSYRWSIAEATASLDLSGVWPKQLQSKASGLCLDDPKNSTTDGTVLAIQFCVDAPNQKYTLTSGGALQVVGKCVQPSNGGTANGTPVVIATCVSGRTSQQWAYRADRTLRNASSGRCLSVVGGPIVAGGGTKTELRDCVAGSHQVWDGRLP